MFKQSAIYITETDRTRLENLIQLVRRQNDRAHFVYVNRLEEELEFAETIAPERVPPDVVTMRSKVRLKDLETGEENEYTLVFPTEADFSEGKISILAPLATALIGSRRGETIEFQAPTRRRRLEIREILYQPESAGEYDL